MNPRSFLPMLVATLALQTAAGSAAVLQDPPAVRTPARTTEGSARAVTVPFTLDHNRMIVEVELIRPDGTMRTAAAWVDTGNQYLVMTRTVAEDIRLPMVPAGLDPTYLSVEAGSSPPQLRVAGFALDLSGVEIRISSEARIMPGVPAEIHLPVSALRREHVIMDYPNRRLTIARPGTVEPQGLELPCRVNTSTGLFMTAATIDGESVHVGLDTGSSGTWVSNQLTATWLAQHPHWRHAVGALGSANFWGFDFEVRGELMTLPELRLGTLTIADVAVLGLDQTLFDWYSAKSAAPLAAILGANVLTRFRLEIDFPSQMTYWRAGPSVEARDLDIVGITVRAERDGGYSVAGVVETEGAPAVPGVYPGDRLVKIGAVETSAATMGQVIDALRGRVGETRTLVLERAGVTLTVDAKVARFP